LLWHVHLAIYRVAEKVSRNFFPYLRQILKAFERLLADHGRVRAYATVLRLSVACRLT